MHIPQYDIVLFDLDGTLTDTGEGIIKSVQYALECVGITETKEQNLRRFIGPSLWASFTGFYGMDDKTAALAVEKYRERYNRRCIAETRVYEGADTFLAELCKNGVKLCTASTKPEFYVEKILKAFGLFPCFDAICGSELSGARSDKAELIPCALERLHANGSERVVMVGDRCFDAEGARRCGIDFIGVLYGFGSREELEREPHKALCKNVRELRQALLH